MEELPLPVSYLNQFIWFRFKGCSKGFPLIKNTYVPCLEVATLCAFTLWEVWLF